MKYVNINESNLNFYSIMKYLFLFFPILAFSQYKIDYFETAQDMAYYKGELFATVEESIYEKSTTDSIPSEKNVAEEGFVIKEVSTDEMAYDFITVLPLSFNPSTYFNNSQNLFSSLESKIYEKGQIVIKDTLPNINWRIIDETKNILGYKCQKATGTYKCREYTVWFTNEIPLSIGPWHLNGLPGAILEATENSNYLKFEAVKVSEIVDYKKMKEKIKNQSNYETIDYQDYVHKLDEYSVESSKQLIKNISETEIEGAKINSLKSTISFETYDLCRGSKKKQVEKHFQ